MKSPLKGYREVAKRYDVAHTFLIKAVIDGVIPGRDAGGAIWLVDDQSPAFGTFLSSYRAIPEAEGIDLPPGYRLRRPTPYMGYDGIKFSAPIFYYGEYQICYPGRFPAEELMLHNDIGVALKFESPREAAEAAWNHYYAAKKKVSNSWHQS